MGAWVHLGRPGRESARKGDDIQNEYRPGLERPAGLFSALSNVPRAPNVMLARGAIGIQQMVGAMVLPRAVSHVAHDHADELIEVNRALPGS
jgi:hypothetical protein